MEKNNNQPLITILIPVYKVEKYLEKCIESVINQTYFNLEIILIDDGSPDNCGIICDEYAKKDSRIKVLHKENRGISDVRNRGIQIATGKYFTFIDSDDYVSPDYIEYLYNLIVKYDADISICNIKVIWKNTKLKLKNNNKEFIFNSETAFKNMLFNQGINVSVCTKLYKTTLWKNIKFPINKVYEDTAIIYKIIDKANKIAYGNKECYFYVAREGSISKKGNFNKNELDYMKYTEKMLKFIKKKYSNLSLAADRFCLYSNFRVLRMLVLTTPRNKKLEKEIKKVIKGIQTKVFFLKETPIRDRIAIISLCFGLPIFKLSWKIYVKMTGRIY